MKTVCEPRTNATLSDRPCKQVVRYHHCNETYRGTGHDGDLSGVCYEVTHVAPLYLSLHRGCADLCPYTHTSSAEGPSTHVRRHPWEGSSLIVSIQGMVYSAAPLRVSSFENTSSSAVLARSNDTAYAESRHQTCHVFHTAAVLH